jgi:hypothetical protein
MKTLTADELTTRRREAVEYVAYNWRVRQRLPRVTALARRLGMIAVHPDGSDVEEYGAATLKKSS